MKIALPALLLLAACATAEERTYAEMQPFVGRPLTAYMTATGDTPASFYDTAEGRNFVFKPRGLVACNRTITAQRAGQETTPDAFQITRISSVGNC